MNILIIAGGTGGHVYPALSIAREFNRKGHSISWIGQEGSLEERICLDEKYLFYHVKSKGYLGKGFIQKLVALYFFKVAFIKSFFLIKKIKPDLVISMGGYVTLGPALVGSFFSPLFIHEQNSIAGLANKILHRRSQITFEAFPETFRNFKHKVACVGNPVRKEIADLSHKEIRDSSMFRILVLGGSQGSKQINEIITSALNHKTISPKWSFVHQTGKLEHYDLKQAYINSGAKFEIKEYIHDMASEYRNCDIIISRSGAMTVSEICSAGKPSILLPLPWSADNHQRINAMYLHEKGAAEVIESNISNSESLFNLLIGLENNHNKRKSMMHAASKVFPEFTSEKIYKIIYESLKI